MTRIDFSDVRGSISSGNIPADSRDLNLAALDAPARLATGRGGDDSYVFVAPGQPVGAVVSGQRFNFQPWTGLVDHHTGIALADVCVLRFWPPSDGVDVDDAIAAVFAGLIELARSAPDQLGTAIEAMRALFESGLRSTVSTETEIGLAGELLVISAASDQSKLVAMWHSNADDRFDFSAPGERLEVKTSTSERTHWFSSNQVTPIPGVCTTFVSIVLPRVATGTTVAELFAGLTSLNDTERSRVRTIIIDVANEPPEMLTSVVFDDVAARASIIHFTSGAIPTPTPTPGVGRMRWEATIDPLALGPTPTCPVSAALDTPGDA